MATKLDVESQRAAQLLTALARNNVRLAALQTAVRAHPEVVTSRHALDLRDYESGPVLEGYVDAELQSGQALAWWVEAHWDPSGWRIDSSVRVDHADGEDLIWSFPPRCASTLDTLIAQLDDAISDLAASADETNFARPGA